MSAESFARIVSLQAKARRKQNAWTEQHRADYLASRPMQVLKSWSPVLTDEQRKEREEYIKLHKLPF